MDTIESLKKRRTHFYRQFTREYNSAKLITQREVSKEDVTELKTRVTEMGKAIGSYVLLNASLFEKWMETDNPEAELDETATRETDDRIKMNNISQFIEEHCEKSQPGITVTTKQDPHSGMAKLPKLQLPTFDGTYTKWTAFWDTMQADVMSGSYSNITKFNYIMGQLKGSALEAVRGIHASGENLSNLVQILMERFGQKRKIIRSHVNNMIDTSAPSYSYGSLTKFYNQINGDLRSLEHLGVPIEECAAFVVPILEKKIPKQMQEKMGTCGQGERFVLKLFLKAFQEHLENLGEQNDGLKSPVRQTMEPTKQQNITTTESFVNMTTPRRRNCEICGDEHFAVQCSLNPKERLETVKSKKLCFICLKKHGFGACQSGSNMPSCRTCKRSRHHTALHDSFGNKPQGEVPVAATSTTGCAVNTHLDYTVDADVDYTVHQSDLAPTTVGCSVNMDNPVLLETGQVTMENNSKNCRASVLMDRGSMQSYLTREVANVLNLQPYSCKSMFVNGFGGHTTKKVYDVAKVGVQTIEGTKHIEVLITDQIVKPILRKGWKRCLEYEYVASQKLADNFEDDLLKIDCLIGCDNAYLFLDNRIIKGEGPVVQFSNLGCFVSGPLKQVGQNSNHSCTTAIISRYVSVNDMLLQQDNSQLNDKSLEFYMKDSNLSQIEYMDNLEDTFVRNYMENIHVRDSCYHVPLPWRPDHPELPNNLATSRARLNQVTARLKRLRLTEAYQGVMQENIANGYVEETKNPQEALQEKDCYYLPHFFVLKDSETTPLRIVFDASCGSPSLNSCLHEGPNMLNDLVKLLSLFRVGKVALVADIARAFLSVKLLESDRKYVRFLWFKDNDINDKIVPYHCNTVIFGNVSSPFSLAIVLYKHLSCNGGPIAKDMMSKLYVDNLLTTTNNDSLALEYYNQSRTIMKEGSFILRQWASNSNQVMEQVCKDGLQTTGKVIHTLGLKWNFKEDTLHFARKEFMLTEPITKRIVSSQTASIFDPLGLIAPVIIPARLFINELWTNKKSWDEELNHIEIERWKQILGSLRESQNLSLPRFLGVDQSEPVTLIIFCDASPKAAVGCVAYIKQKDKTCLIGSKSKVVSNSKLTTPKAELQAMTIGVKYGEWIVQTYKDSYPSINTVYITDSEIALHWINSKKKLKPFVQNRVDTINSKSDISQWYHIKSGENMADILSRGVTCHELTKSKWFSGPVWLQDDFKTWPISKPMQESTVILAASVEIENEWKLDAADITKVIDIDRFSDYRKLLRVTSLVQKAFLKGNRFITATDMNDAEHKWIMCVQKHYYEEAFKALNQDGTCKSNGKKLPPIVHQLGLIISQDGLIRCAGRVRTHPCYDQENKLPILLPRDCQLTKLIIVQAHQTVKHYGVGATMAHLREKFWITSMRSTVGRVLNKCVTCRKVSGRPYQTPQAPPLPEFRLDESRPYKAVAIDFTGHLMVKEGKTVRKCYLCLFTCCATRNIHLEIVDDMSTLTFLRAFRRFCAAYSVPEIIYCDNAKTFKASDTELKRLYDIVDTQETQKHLSEKRIKFKYIPVQASWMAGVHERCIGTCKKAIRKVLGKAMICRDELCTLIKEVQAIVNNRPLTYVSSNLEELEILSPNHLIYGRQIGLIAHEQTDNMEFDANFGGKEHLERMAYLRSQLIENFRHRFQNEYLAMLRERHAHVAKTNPKTEDSVKVGDVVIVYDKDLPRRDWKLGVVQKLLRGTDGLTRAASIKTNSGTSNRAVAHLYPLEITTDCTAQVRANAQDTSIKRIVTKRKAAVAAERQIKSQMDYLNA